jgi:putative membrane protein
LSDAIAEMADDTPLTEGERTHILGLFVSFITGLPQLFFPIVAAIFGTGSRNNPQLIPIVILGVMLISLLFRWIAWLRFRFHLDDDDIRIESGLLNRTVRSIPYDRIQDVSIEEKPLARMLGLGEVKFETGGGEGEDAKLSFVTMERAAALRETIRARKSAEAVEVVSKAMAREMPPIFAMDNGRLITLGLYSFSLVIFAVLGGLAQQFDFLLPFDWWDFKHWIGMAAERGVSVDGIGVGAGLVGAVVALLALIVIGFATGIVRTVLKEYGFRLDRTERGFRRRRGFLTRTDVMMPVNRVQAVNIVTGPIRKRRGWYALKLVSLAQDSKEESDYMAAPLAKLDEIWPIAAEPGIAPPAGDTEMRKAPLRWWLVGVLVVMPFVLGGMVAVVMFANSSMAKAMLFLLIPAMLFLVGMLQWRKYRDLVDDRQLYVREGWWRQRLGIAPQVNVQSVEIHQGPIARMLGFCTLNFGIAGGSLAFSALSVAEARAIRDQVMAVVAPVDFSELNRRG